MSQAVSITIIVALLLCPVLLIVAAVLWLRAKKQAQSLQERFSGVLDAAKESERIMGPMPSPAPGSAPAFPARCQTARRASKRSYCPWVRRFLCRRAYGTCSAPLSPGIGKPFPCASWPSIAGQALVAASGGGVRKCSRSRHFTAFDQQIGIAPDVVVPLIFV